MHPDNAISVLGQLLAQDPSNQEAIQLLEKAKNTKKEFARFYDIQEEVFESLENTRQQETERLEEQRAILVEQERIKAAEKGQKQVPRRSEIFIENSTRFVAHNDSVEDTRTGLIWTRDVGPRCDSLKDVKEYITLLRATQGLDWRLPNNWEMETLLNKRQDSPGLPTAHPFRKIEVETSEILSKEVIVYNIDQDEYRAINVKDGHSGSKVFCSGPDCIFESKYRDWGIYIWPVRGKMIFKEKAAKLRQRYFDWSTLVLIYSVVFFFMGIMGLLSFFGGTLHEWSWGIVLQILFVYTPIFLYGGMAVIFILTRLFRKWRWNRL